MSVSRTWWIFVVVVLGVACAAALLIAPESNQGFRDAAAVIAFATMVAVGIERTFEIVWTLIDQAKGLGAYWPMSLIAPQITAIEDETNTLLTPLATSVTNALNAAKAKAQAAGEDVARFDDQLAKLDQARITAQARFSAATSLAPGSTRIANVAAAADAMSEQLHGTLKAFDLTTGGIKKDLDLVSIRLGSAIDIIATFQDNPARRLSSLLLGAAAGALIAGFVGINLFAAIVDGGPELLNGSLGVLITGLVAGLGSSPTHELVKSLQSSKKARQVQPVAAGPDGTGSSGSVAAWGLMGHMGGGVQGLPTTGGRTVFIRSTD